MPKIKLLTDNLINKIAAGEVVERPANIVKELIENSIDANATQIFVEVNEGGRTLIKVKDNGEGMPQQDALLSLQRHTTSKLSSDKELHSISTLGFRGEALASIAAISHLKLTTKTIDNLEGTEIKAEGGKITSVKQIGAPTGTTLEITHLFYNTPARKKYLKSIQTELSVICDIVTRYALSSPQIYLKLLHNNKPIITSPNTDDRLANITYIYGSELTKNLIQVNHESTDIEIKGFISLPEYTKPSKSFQSIFINGRYVKQSVIGDALYQAFQSSLMINRHPVAILNINIDPSKLDVNVHPTKSIVKIEREDILHTKITDAVTESLASITPIPAVTDKDIKDIPLKRFDSKYPITKDSQTLLEPTIKIKPIIVETKLPYMKPLTQIHKTYLLAESDSGLIILDQHAVEERINYEKFLKNTKIRIQPLLNPDMIEVSPEELALITENKGILKEAGFIIEDFGTNTITVRTVPIIVGKTYTTQLFMDLISDMKKFKIKTSKLIQEKIASKSCRASIKAGDELTLPQIQKLLNNLNECKNPFCCPHGRPTIINFSLTEIEKKFKRIV